MLIVDPLDMSKAFDATQASPEQMYAVAVSGQVAKSIPEQKGPIEERLKEMLFSVDGRVGFAQWLKDEHDEHAILFKDLDALTVARFGWPAETKEMWSSQKVRNSDQPPYHHRVFTKVPSSEVESVEYATNPSIRVKEVKNARLYSEIFRRVLMRSKESIQRQLTYDIFGSLSKASAPYEGDIEGGVTFCHPTRAGHILMNTASHPIASTMIPRDAAYHVPGGRGAAYLDIIDVVFMAADSPNEDYDEGRFGWVVAVDCRLGVLADAEINKLTLSA